MFSLKQNMFLVMTLSMSLLCFASDIELGTVHTERKGYQSPQRHRADNNHIAHEIVHTQPHGETHLHGTTPRAAGYATLSQLHTQNGHNNEGICTSKCAGIGLGGTIVTAGVIYGILAGVGIAEYNDYHIINNVRKPISLRIRGNSYDCYNTRRHTDSKGHTTTSRVAADCKKVLYPGDRTTLRNYGHLTKLGAYFYDANWGYEYGTYQEVTHKGLKDLDWYVHNKGKKLVFTRNTPPANSTQTAAEAYRSYSDNTTDASYHNLRDLVGIDKK